MNTKGSKKPSFSTKPTIVKKSTPASRAEIEKKIKDKYEAMKKAQAAKVKEQPKNVTKRIFSDKNKATIVEIQESAPVNKSRPLTTTQRTGPVKNNVKLSEIEQRNERDRIEKIRQREIRKAEREKRMNAAQANKTTSNSQPQPQQQPELFTGKKQRAAKDFTKQNYAKRLKEEEEERLRKHRALQEKKSQQKTVSKNTKEREQLIKQRLANRPIVNKFSLNFEELKFRKKSDSVFIVAGGPSLSGFDFSKLDGYDTIAVNKSIEFIKDPTYFITVDYTFMNKTRANIRQISSLRKTATIFVAAADVLKQDANGVFQDDQNNITYSRLNDFNIVIKSRSPIDKETGFGKSISNFTRGFNSGFCAIQLALLLGYEKIYLLGFDMNVDSGKTHFHDGYNGNSNIKTSISSYKEMTVNALRLTKDIDKIYSCSPVSSLNETIKYIDIDEAIKNAKKTSTGTGLDSLMIVGYYTINTPYEEEAQGLIGSCKKLGLNHDIIGVKSLGDWQSNTRFKAKFMLDMLNKHPNMRLLYVDCDAEIHSLPNLFINYSADIAVRFQDFNYRKNECLSGTIYMENNLRTRKLCELWFNSNRDGSQRGLEQWNLGSIIETMTKKDGLIFKNLPPEYTFIFDIMKKIYPNAKPVIEHYQASRRFRNKIK